MRLASKVALITGAGSGIGRATALRFAAEGARVVVVDWKPEGGRETVARIQADGGEAISVRADVSQEADVQRMVATAVATFGRLDILVNNAAVQVFGTVPETSTSDWHKVLDVNLKGLCFGIQDEVTNYRQAARKDRALEHVFIAGCCRRGVNFAVSPHHGFSAAHTESDMDRVLHTVDETLGEIYR